MHAKQPGSGVDDMPGDRLAIAIQVAAVTLFSGLIAYVATNPEQLVHAASTAASVYAPVPQAAEQPAVPPVPVQVKNPFDATEVFEFPPGTRDTDANLAVANLLLQRARDREQLWSQPGHKSRKRANHLQPVTTTSLTVDAP